MPDFAFSLPLFDGSQLCAKFKDMDSSENFNASCSSQYPEELMLSPRKTSKFCFPWAIAEVTDQNVYASEARYLYCQAANASAAASAMLSRLCERGDEFHEITEIPPVLALTFLGARVKIWVTFVNDMYKSKKTGRH